MNSVTQLQHPDDKMPRIITIDVLRGFALFGILYAHMILWYAAGPLTEDAYKPNDIASGLTMASLMIFFMSKFFSLFSFLFGLSFYIQIQGLAKRHENIVLRFGWRLCILGIIGLIHHAIWRADILSIYVPLGFLLIFMRNLSNKTLFILGTLLVLNIPTKVAELIAIVTTGSQELIATDNLSEGIEYSRIMREAGFVEMLNHNIHAMDDKYIYQITSGRLLITLGFFLLGMLAGRMHWFEQLAQHQPALKKWLKQTGWIIVGCLVTGIVAAIGFHLAGINVEKTPLAIWSGGFIWDLYNLCMTLVYIFTICLLMLNPRWYLRLAPLAGVGKMALSSYLMQTAFGLLVFFHLGFGLFLHTPQWLNALISLAFFGLQIVFCRWWLSHFYYGPIEWLWRSATDLKWKPMVKLGNPDNLEQINKQTL